MPAQGRPDLPESYGLREPAEGVDLLPWRWVEEQMIAARNYWIGTTRPDGRPHATPVWGVWHEGAFYFSTGRGSRKALNLAVNPALVVHLESGDEVVILEGAAVEITSPAKIDRIDAAYFAKYQVHVRDEAGEGGLVYTLQPRTAFAWLESDFVASATRWLFTED